MLRKILFFGLFLSHTISVLAQQTERYQRVWVNMSGRNIAEIGALGLEAEHGVYKQNAYFMHEFAESEVEKLRQAGFEVTVLEADLVKSIAERDRRDMANRQKGAACGIGKYPYNTPSGYREGSMSGYHTVEEAYAQLDSMRARFPNLISARIPFPDSLKSVEGRQIFWLRLSDNPTVEENEPEVFYNAMIHAREPNALSEMLFYMWYLLENYATNPEIKYLVDNTEMFFIPIVNPDGVTYNQQTAPTGGGMWRKNRRLNSGGSYGVDLNRNFGYLWGLDNTGSSPTQSSETYRGTAPFSEPETRAIRYLCLQHNFNITLNTHTYANDVVYPWGYANLLTPDSIEYRRVSDLMTAQNTWGHGTGFETIGYNTNGDSDDWMYGDTITKNKIISMTPEVGPNYFGFWPPRTAIEQINKASVYMNLALPRVQHNFGVAKDLSPRFLPQISGTMPFSVQRFGRVSGNLTAILRGVSPNVVSTSAAQVFNLQRFAVSNGSFNYALNTNVAQGDELVFVLELTNGTVTWRDTLRKIYGTPTALLSDAGAALSPNFTASASWGISTAQFYSSPSSITDSPTGNYANNASNTITTRSLALPQNATNITLQFFAKWEIAPDGDMVQPQISIDGGAFQPICGLWTRPHPTTGLPIYDAWQSRWLEEAFDFTPYRGRNVQFRFALSSTASVRTDGFYFDDMAVKVTTGTTTKTHFLENSDFSFSQNAPNPTSVGTNIKIETDFLTYKNVELVVTDLQGRVMYRSKTQKSDIWVDTNTWQSGIYFYHFVADGKMSAAKKMVVER